MALVLHHRVEVQGFLIKMTMTASSVFINGLTWLSVVYLISSFCLCYLYLKWVPHLTDWVNHVRVGTYFCILYASLVFIILAYAPGVDQDDPSAVSTFR